MNVKKIVGVFVCLFISSNFLSAQQVKKDSISTVSEYYQLGAKDTISVVSEKLHSPSRATIYEALVPGLGHIYNKKAWHLPITYAAFGTSVFFIVNNTKNFKKYKDAYADFTVYLDFRKQEAQFPMPMQEPSYQRFRKILDADYKSFTGKQLEHFKKALKNRKDSYRRYRDLSYISLAAVYVLNIIWAAVDAHFFYYDVSDDLSLRIQPQMLVMQDYKQGVAVNLVFNF